MILAESGTGSEIRQNVGGISLIPRNSPSSVDELHDLESPLVNAEIRSDEYGDVVLSLFERSGIGLAILDPTLRVRSVNSAFSAQCGRRHDEICERGFAEFLHPSVRQYVLRQFGRLVQGHHARLVGRSITMWFHDTAVSGKLAAFPVEDTVGKVKMILVQFTPEEAADDHQALVGSQWRLTPLTAKVLEGVAAGDPTVRLAAKLFLSRQGVEYHVSLLLRQFKVPNRTALAAKAYSMGMFSIGCWPPSILPEYVRPGRQGTDRARGEAGMQARRP
ncbi:DNA-binding CsgD family transcriptional regulator [Streptomyces umbrinus]|uniref:DNA-binding CsgD family transcriptional regulator n=1 Tax=Streptomyces umbrinus TaxID=67370 RepID=A0ABU0SNC0_9ACTN|nr:LuxR C-terminal-related transcriptional regulator [Streptomyces umbrinus]MDQ1025048.1 DNA-binding CsgD family transcriptional regulator [Streptomyces umbrinus]